MGFETVHTMTDWYDGPRRGVAMVDGRPHLYESCWNDIDSDEETLYLLTPISEELLANAIEDWEIWKRWSHAHKLGNASIESHPALPSDHARHAQLAALLKKQLIIDEHCKLVAIAKFRYNADAKPNMEAEWVIVNYDQSKDKRDKYRWGIEDEDDPNNPMDRSGGSAAS
jgi:hypothetical protein